MLRVQACVEHRYAVIFEKEARGCYHVFCRSMPGRHTRSETIEEDVESIREAIGSTWKVQ